jgi:hypothetical protein
VPTPQGGPRHSITTFCRQEVIATTDAAPQSGSRSWLRLGVPYLLFAVALAGGILLGIEHHRDGMRALFVFRGTEPLPAWVAVGSLLGTLPATLLALIHPRAAACVLWVLAASLFVVWAVYSFTVEPGEPRLLDALSWVAGRPAAQALVGATFWFSRRPGQSD